MTAHDSGAQAFAMQSCEGCPQWMEAPGHARCWLLIASWCCCSKGMDANEALRAFLTAGSRQGGKGDESGPSAADLRELRSLSLSFSLVGPPIGVSLPDSDLKDLRYFLDCKSIPSSKVCFIDCVCPSPLSSIFAASS